MVSTYVGRVLLPAIVFLVGAFPVFSGPLTWTVNGVFRDGGTLTGSYVFDPATQLFSSISVVAGAGGGYSQVTFNQLNPAVLLANYFYFELADAAGSRTDHPELSLFLSGGGMTGSGGTVQILPADASQEWTCQVSSCGSAPFQSRFIQSGTVTAPSATPEPAAWSLMVIGALALAGRARLQTLRRRHPNSPSR